MGGSGLALIQTTEAYRYSALAGQMVPEARASRASFHCSGRVSPGWAGKGWHSPTQTMSTVQLAYISHRGARCEQNKHAPSPPRANANGRGTEISSNCQQHSQSSPAGGHAEIRKDNDELGPRRNEGPDREAGGEDATELRSSESERPSPMRKPRHYRWKWSEQLEELQTPAR